MDKMMEAQRGQILLIVVLVMVTALTVGLSVAARTITNIRTSQEAENSEKAFSAAEAGIERSLTNGLPVTGNFSNNTTYTTTVSTISGVEFPLNNGVPILKDDAYDIWLSTYPGYTNPWSGTMTLYWGQLSDVCSNSEATNTMAAVEIVVLSGPVTNPSMSRYAVDPCSQRSLQNRFEYVSPNGGVVSNKTYAFRRTITVNSGLFVRIIPLYAPVSMGVRGCDAANAACTALPSQGTVVEATGIADNTQRKLVSYRRYPKLPTELFPYSFFAPQ
jgi:Tfp pilus assembly protein PilX